LRHVTRPKCGVMGPEIKTERVRRTWLDKLLLWRRAYRTRIYDAHREAIGRGPTVEASREAALNVWVSEGQSEDDSAASLKSDVSV
jgi:hypothetical protein